MSRPNTPQGRHIENESSFYYEEDDVYQYVMWSERRERSLQELVSDLTADSCSAESIEAQQAYEQAAKKLIAVLEGRY